jgi:hypothetical protein
MGFASSARSIPLMTNSAALPIVGQILDLFLACFFSFFIQCYEGI